MSCPICGNPTERDFRPFCSKRCAEVDLARWFNGAYSVPSQNPEDAAEISDALEAELLAKKSDRPH